jgi:hypothetical protein
VSFLCDVCHGEVDSSDGVLHAVENDYLRFNDPVRFFAFYKWTAEAAESRSLGYVHRGECLEVQIAGYLRRFKWGIRQQTGGSVIIGRKEPTL